MEEFSRTTAPELGIIAQVGVQEATKSVLGNGLTLYDLNAGTQDVLRIEWIFDAGSWYQPYPLIATATNSMLREGTSSMTGSEVAEKLDYYGAFLQMDSGKDVASVTLYTLSKHLESTLPILEEVIKSSTMPEREFDAYCTNSRQQFLVEEEKVSTKARGSFNRAMYGADHPYGLQLDESAFDRVGLDAVKRHYADHYRPDRCTIVVSGKTDAGTLKLIERHFGGNDWAQSDLAPTKNVVVSNQQGKQHVLIDGAVQSALRLGRPLFDKTHVDYHGMKVLTTILGGYFGSRLMTNIREDKGYTYGIGAGIGSFRHGGHFFIASEVGKEVTEPALNEIYLELARLRNEPVTNDELELVKNYMTGEFLRGLDGPFALADKLKGLLLQDLPYSFYEDYVKTINTINPSTLQDLANTYWREESLTEVVAGAAFGQ